MLKIMFSQLGVFCSAFTVPTMRVDRIAIAAAIAVMLVLGFVNIFSVEKVLRCLS